MIWHHIKMVSILTVGMVGLWWLHTRSIWGAALVAAIILHVGLRTIGMVLREVHAQLHEEGPDG